MPALIEQFLKDPFGDLDWAFNWNLTEDGKLPWLAEGETIKEYWIVADTGITVANYVNNNGCITIWISGGVIGQV